MPRPFDERPALCHNRSPVQRPRFLVRLVALAVLAGLLAAVSGCDKPNDQPLLQQEVLATAKDYDRRLDELARRADDIDHRRQALRRATLDSASAEHRLAQARSAIEDRRGYLEAVRARLAGKPGSVTELRGLLDEMRARLDDGVLEANDDLAAVESWIATAAQSQRADAQPPAPEPEPPAPVRSTAPAAPTAGSDDGAPETDSPGAPIR
jgi:hypothetical protein